MLDGFDGAGWTSSARYRPLGAELPAEPAVVAPLDTFDAALTFADDPGPWLPSRSRTVAADGLAPAVDPVTDTLVLAPPAPGAGYRITWREARLASDQLVGAAIDPAAVGSVQLSELPKGVRDTAEEVGGLTTAGAVTGDRAGAGSAGTVAEPTRPQGIRRASRAP